MKNLLLAASLAVLATACSETPERPSDRPAEPDTDMTQAEDQTDSVVAQSTDIDWLPAKPADALRVATFNVSFYREAEGEMLAAIEAGDDPQIAAVADIIRAVDPDVLLLNEIDVNDGGATVNAFIENYLSEDGAPLYPFSYVPDTNTGVASGIDLDGDGQAVTTPGDRFYGNDAYGYGVYEGQYGLAVLSKKRIEEDQARTFRTFLWRDMPENAMPTDFYSAEAQDVFRLSSKTMADVPVLWGDRLVHVIAAHPTPPGFDGPEDRNGRRNHDEIRLIADYVTPGQGDYLYDDDGETGGLAPGSAFVVMGDLNAEPNEGDSYNRAIYQLLGNPFIADPQPESEGGIAAAQRQGGVNADHVTPAAQDTADFRDDTETSVGNLRIDYVLPSNGELAIAGSGVFWPSPDQAGYDLVGPGYPPVSSDHRLVWVDLKRTQTEE